MPEREDHRLAVTDGIAAHEAEGRPFSLTFRIKRGEGSGAEMRLDAAGGGKGQLKGTIQDCSIELGRCLRLSPLLVENVGSPQCSGIAAIWGRPDSLWYPRRFDCAAADHGLSMLGRVGRITARDHHRR